MLKEGIPRSALRASTADDDEDEEAEEDREDKEPARDGEVEVKLRHPKH